MEGGQRRSDYASAHDIVFVPRHKLIHREGRQLLDTYPKRVITPLKRPSSLLDAPLTPDAE
jgi:hypothetical protein